ncbi:hypothetical protein HY624_01125, partial [Candidatus Uhrbacteria bacterium]|nr:hypothetical protein [Candidatus Uhrbacteria bacterium]
MDARPFAKTRHLDFAMFSGTDPWRYCTNFFAIATRIADFGENRNGTGYTLKMGRTKNYTYDFMRFFSRLWESVPYRLLALLTPDGTSSVRHNSVAGTGIAPATS